MNAAGRPPLTLFLPLLALSLALVLTPHHAHGGICWGSMKRNGRCTDLLEERVTREQCCSSSRSPGSAWSKEDLDPGALFFWRALGDGCPCTGCRETCVGVQCGPGERCAVRRGRPRCVCAPRCGAAAGAPKPGPVCGTDGRTYRSLCRLRKRACRRRARDLELDYRGHCQSSCARVRCGAGRHCLVDQNERAHCVRCANSCSRAQLASHEARPLCAADSRTYPSPCHLRLAACRAGRGIPVAYRGPCHPNATCSTIKCRSRQTCLTEPGTGAPRCVTCGSRCPRAPRPRRALCATNNRTYVSWCHMVRDACATGFVIDTRHAGACGSADADDINTVILHEDDKDDEEFDISA